MPSVSYASGRNLSAAGSLEYVSPQGLDPAAFRGKEVQGADKLRYYSDGTQWIAQAPVLSTLVDGGNAASDHSMSAKIDLGTAVGNESFELPEATP